METIQDVAETEAVPAGPSPAETPQTPVESAPAEPAVEAEEEVLDLAAMTAAERMKWRETGKRPEKPASAAAVKPAGTLPASEADPKTPDPKNGNRGTEGSRIAKLLRVNKERDAEIGALKTQLALLQKQPDVKAEPSPAVKTEPAAADSDDLNIEDYATVGEYAKALNARIAKLQKATKDDIAAAIKADRDDQRKQSETAAGKAREDALLETMKPKFAEGVKRHEDFREAVANFWDKTITLPEEASAYIFSKKYGHELLYKLGADFNAGGTLAQGLTALPLHGLIEALADMHREISADLDKPKPAVPRVGKAPLNLAASSAAADDDDALLARDSVAYRKKLNERDLAAQRARRAQIG